jgi:hypothetical protein
MRRTTDLPHVDGVDDGIGFGVHGDSKHINGVYATSEDGTGVYGVSPDGIGVYGNSFNSYGVLGRSYNDFGVYGLSERFIGVKGESHNGSGVNGRSYAGDGVVGWSERGAGVVGESANYDGVHGRSFMGVGVFGASRYGYAALLQGDVHVTGHLRIDGNLSKSGGSFKIDHPLDPANKYLCHSFVESPDMKNVYDGVVTLDDKGEAEIELPDWFGALNKDFRYQLTAIGSPGPNLYITREIFESSTDYFDTTNNNNNNNNNHSSFNIAGGTSGMKVSWQVTGIRKDPWANAHRVEVEENKPEKERGYFMYPELYDQPVDRGISGLHFPEEMKMPLVTKNK